MLQARESLKPWHTFGLDVYAHKIIPFYTEKELDFILASNPIKDEPWLVLGGGSNVLFLKDFEGTVLLNRIQGICMVKELPHEVWVKAGAGVAWNDLVTYTLSQNWGGIENLTLIPGCVGAAPMQNIGAYGVELKDVFDSLEAVEIETQKKVEFSAHDCQFGYRESFFKHAGKGRFIITSVTLRLSKFPVLKINYGDIQNTLNSMEIIQPTIQHISQAVASIRRSKLPDPKQLGNAGSFFKNPEIPENDALMLKEKYPLIPSFPGTQPGYIKISAAWLIEQCGFKGKKYGLCGSHEKQALVLVNYGGATGIEIYQLAKDIIKTVEDTFGITLNPEVNIIT